MTARVASTTRKYTTAFTFSETLSRVMMSCGGISHVTTRNETFTIRSIGQMMRTTPGPFELLSTRPNRKTTARSYSGRMFKHLIIQIRTISATSTDSTPGKGFISIAPGTDTGGHSYFIPRGATSGPRTSSWVPDSSRPYGDEWGMLRPYFEATNWKGTASAVAANHRRSSRIPNDSPTDFLQAQLV